MSPEAIGIAASVLLLVSILVGLPIAYSMLVVSILSMWLMAGSLDVSLSLFVSTAINAVESYVFLVIPLFILMGSFMSNSPAAYFLYRAVNRFLGWMPGGLAVSTVGANGLFAAISGVSVASAAIFSRVAHPEMMRYGYSARMSLGSIAGSSVLGMLIPPSVLMILYGLTGNVSIGAMFLAGVLPGALLMVLFTLMILVLARWRPAAVGGHGQQEASTSREWVSPEGEHIRFSTRAVALGVVPLVLLVAAVLGGLWSGLVTPTEAGAVGALGGGLVAVILGMRAGGSRRSLVESIESTGSIMLLLLSAALFSRVIARSGLPVLIQESVAGAGFGVLGVIVMFLLVLLFLGTILDSASIMIMSVPFMVPTVTALGVDAIWFGVLMVVVIEMGLLTPPFGMVPFAMAPRLRQGETVVDIFVGAFPFVLTMAILVALVMVVPGLATWLPAVML